MDKTLIKLNRLTENTHATLGEMTLDGVMMGATLENSPTGVQKEGNGRIQAGTYDITLRSASSMSTKYAQKFPKFHDGMLWLRDVPNYKWVYIHIGNWACDTQGCILIGTYGIESDKRPAVYKSKKAYQDLYLKVKKQALLRTLSIQITDIAQ